MLNVEATMKALLEQEDLDQDSLVTVDDDGPKVERNAVVLKSIPANGQPCSCLFRNF